MARKAYSEEDRVQVRNALMTTMIQCIADRGLIHSSIDVLCRKVGISKTFFYSFFSSKEELVLYALRYQQPKLLDYARSLMEDPGLSWRAGVETFLKNCCYGAKSGVAVLSIEEEQQVRHCLSEENFQAFRRDQIIFYGKLLSIFSLPVDSIDPRLFGNLALSMMMVHKAIPDTMPFLFPEVAEDMLQVEYPNCFLLDMGWYQDRYIISVIHNFDWANPVQQYETTETNQLPKLLTEAVRLVEKESQSAGAN